MARRVRLLTLNLWGIEGDWAARRSVLKAGLRDLHPDAVVFQESIKTADYDQAKDLLSAEYTRIHQEGRSPDGTGNTIACCLPLGEVRQRFLQVTPRVDSAHQWIGSVAAVEVRSPNPIGDFLLAHLKPSWQLDYDRERELQAVAAARFIEEALQGRDIHVVLAGDLDASPDSSSIRFWKGQQSIQSVSVRYHDAWEGIHGQEGHTFTPRNPLVATEDMSRESGRRIDYILVRCDVDGPTLKVANCFLAFDEPVKGVWATDHFGVVADLLLPTL